MPSTHTPTAPAPTTTDTQAPTGRRVELAHYPSDSGERVLVAQRVDGKVRVTDEPHTGTGRRYLVEAHLESQAALDALVSDYLEKARRLGYAPMHGWF